jgi:hypothetical protein
MIQGLVVAWDGEREVIQPFQGTIGYAERLVSAMVYEQQFHHCIVCSEFTGYVWAEQHSWETLK